MIMTTYVIFDGDKDKWAYAFMKGWKVNDRIEFDFQDAHDLDNMTGLASSEAYVKQNLKARLDKSRSVIVLVGDSTKNLFKYVRWEIELAISLGLPIIVVNLNGERNADDNLCPAILRNKCAVHVSYHRAIIKHALDNWPQEYKGLPIEKKSVGARTYGKPVYNSLGL